MKISANFRFIFQLEFLVLFIDNGYRWQPFVLYNLYRINYACAPANFRAVPSWSLPPPPSHRRRRRRRFNIFIAGALGTMYILLS